MLVGSDLASTAEFVSLTLREQEIALLIREGLSNREIADRLVVAEQTVKTHVSSILRKFGVKQRSEIAAFIRRHLD